jgi:O-antigen/teichoic acid export membrane protein
MTNTQSNESVAPPVAPEPQPPVETQGMADKVGGGMTWMTVSTLATRVITFAAQILMGRWLSPAEFALYGTATAVAGYLMVCRDAGTGYILVQRGREKYEENAGPAFWLGFTYNVSVVLLTLVIAGVLAQYYKAPELRPMLIVMTLSLPAGAIANVLYSKLRLDLHFRAFSIINTASTFVRQVSMILLAWGGFKHMSFAWPAVICIFVDSILLWWLTRDSIWMRAPRFDQWGSWIRDAVWLMITSLANFGMDWAPYLVLGRQLGADNPVIGYYFFAYQITAQIGVLLAFNSTVVLTPAFQKLNHDPRRQSAAALRALRTLMLAGSVASLGLAAIMSPLEHMLWGAKYAESVSAVLVFGAFYPWRITYGLTSSLLTAQGRFRQLTYLSIIECLGLMAAAWYAGQSDPTPSGIAWWTGGWVFVSRLVATLYVFIRLGESPMRVMKDMFPAWAISLAGFGVAILAARKFDLAGAVGGWFSHTSLPLAFTSRVGDVAAIMVFGGVCAFVMAMLARVVLHAHLRDLISVSPGKLRGPMRTIFRLPVDPV